MSLFQKSVLKPHLSNLDENIIQQSWKIYQSYFLDPSKQKIIFEKKEEELQYEFLMQLFDKCLGYDIGVGSQNLFVEQKNQTDSKKADGAIKIKGEIVCVIELKSTKTKNLKDVEKQAFGYKVSHPKCKYVVTSNFNKLRFYVDNTTEFEEFDLFNLTNDRFKLLWLCLSYDSISSNKPQKLSEESLVNEEKITKNLYKDYSEFRRKLFTDLKENNPQIEPEVLLQKTQKLLDRLLFILFCEDRGLLPSNSISEINRYWDKKKAFGDDETLYNTYVTYFNVINKGRPQRDNKEAIYAYNGGLFQEDKILDKLVISDDLFLDYSKKLTAYDFESEVSVNILGHIFEHSLSEIEELQNQIEGQELDKSKSKRKKDGVFYTPQFITKYIVENTVGKLCEEKKIELNIVEEDYLKGRKGRPKNKLESLRDILEEYRKWLLKLTICDPACGSGAFLNQALEFLISEHNYIDELQNSLLGGGFKFPEVENSILENNLYGVDINKESVEIAKLSLWLRTAQKGRKLTSLNNNIKCGNSLIDDPEIAGDKAFNWENEFPDVFEKGGFDVVIGNPPYVVYIKSVFGEPILNYVNKNYLYSEYNPNTYALFTDLAINKLIKKDGYLGFILPNSWLEGQYFSKMRNDVYKKYVEEIVYLKNTVFNEVVETVILNVKNRNSNKYDIKLTSNIIKDNFVIQEIEYSKFSKGFNPFVYSSNPLFEKLEKNFDTIKDHAIVYRGLETRNNKLWITEKKESDNHLPILLGKDVNRYYINYSGSYVNFIQKEMKSNANLEMYLQDKILMRRTGSYIIATKDVNKMIVLKNSYLIVPDEKDKIDALLAQLNSKLLAFYHKSKTSAENKAFAQFKGVYVLQFPFEYNSSFDFSTIVDRRISLEDKLLKTKESFLKYIIGKYSISKVTRTFEKWYELDFTGFMKELNRAIKVTNKERLKEKLEAITTLTKLDEMEWMDAFETKKNEAQDIQSKIKQSEIEIDQMVYKLYGLTKKEIEIVENATK